MCIAVGMKYLSQDLTMMIITSSLLVHAPGTPIEISQIQLSVADDINVALKNTPLYLETTGVNILYVGCIFYYVIIGYRTSNLELLVI